MRLDMQGGATGNGRRSALIRAEQTRLLYSGMPLATIATLVNAGVLAVVQWPVIGHGLLLAWLGCLLLVTFARAGLAFSFQHSSRISAGTGAWYSRFVIGTALAGLLWAAAGVLLFPAQDMVRQVFLAFILGGITAGAVTTLSASWGTVALFISLALLPLAGRFFMAGETLDIAMGGMILLYLGIISGSAWRIHGHIVESVRLRIDSAPREEALAQNVRSLQRLLEITAQHALSFEEKIHRLLKLGIEIFGLPQANVSRIEGNRYLIEYMVGPESAQPAGTSLELAETYCEHTLVANRSTSFHHVGHSGFNTHPAYRKFHLEAYIGMPIFVDGSAYGTLSFSGTEPKDAAFTENQHSMIQLLAQWIGDEISRLRAQHKRDQSEEQTRLILESAGEGVYGLDLEGKATFVNPAAARMLGYRPEELVGQPVHALIHHSRADGSTYPVESCPMYAAFTDGSSRRITDEVLWRKDGSSFPVEYTSTPIRKQGQLTGAVVSFLDISERVEAERRMNRFKYVLDDTLDMIFMFEPDTLRFVYLNKGAAASMGYTQEELLGMTPHEIKPLIPEREFRKLIEPLISGQQASLNFETVHRRKDGSDFPVEIFLQLVTEPGGRGLFVAIVRDITERRQSEQNLLRQHRLLDAISRTQSRFIRDTSPQELFEGVLTDILSLTGSEYGFIGEVLYKEDGQPFLKTFAITDISWNKETRDFYADNAPKGMEFYNLDTLFGAAMVNGEPVITNEPETDSRSGGLPEGHPPLHAFLAVPFYLGEEMVGMLGIANRPGGYDEALVSFLQPISNTCAHIIEALRNDMQRKQAETSLRESATRISALVDTVVDGIITINDRGIVDSFNPAAERIFGYDADEVIGRNVKMLMPEPYCDEHDRYLEKYRLTGVARIVGVGREVEGRRKDGARFPLELAVSEMQLEGQRMFTGIVRDITERKKMDRMKNEFVSTVSHELRTPLTSIRGSLGLIAGGAVGELPEQARRLIDIAYNNSERLIHLINDILDMEKIASGKMKFDFQVQPLMPLIEQALEANRAYAEQFGVSLELIDRLEGVEVDVDPGRLLQVLSNLLSNAAKFSPADGKVQVAVMRHDGFIRVTVTDCGEGVPEAFRDSIFLKFSQADASDTRQKGGTGLGLSISKSIVETMGGSIGFETETGVGSTFFFDLPVWGGRQSDVSDDTGFAVDAPRLLVCEDDRDIAHLLAMMLRRDGFEADLAYDAEQAKAMLAEHHYVAMTLDLCLPGQDGVSLIRELRSLAETRDLPIIVVSAKVEEGRLAINGDFSAIDWLGKPIDEQRLVDAVERIHSQSAGHRPRILHVEDDAGIRRVVAEICKDIAEFDYAQSLRQAAVKLSRQRYHLIVLDLSLPDGSGWQVLPMMKNLRPQPAVVVLSAAEVLNEEARKVSAAMVKSRTSNQELLETIRAVIGEQIPA